MRPTKNTKQSNTIHIVTREYVSLKHATPSHEVMEYLEFIVFSLSS